MYILTHYITTPIWYLVLYSCKHDPVMRVNVVANKYGWKPRVDFTFGGKSHQLKTSYKTCHVKSMYHATVIISPPITWLMFDHVPGIRNTYHVEFSGKTRRNYSQTSPRVKYQKKKTSTAMSINYRYPSSHRIPLLFILFYAFLLVFGK